MFLMHDIEDKYYLYVFLQKWHSIVQFSKILDTTFKSVLSFQFKKNTIIYSVWNLQHFLPSGDIENVYN